MKRRVKLLLVGVITVASMAIVFGMAPISQNQAYHSFADNRTFIGLPNFLNVVTNLPFIFIGIYGFLLLGKFYGTKPIFLIYATLCLGIFLTGLGSSYYHYNPNNFTLIFDRVPMTIVFVSFTMFAFAECINARLALILFIPILMIGLASVLYWGYTELLGHGDLRFYGFVQFYPILFIPLLVFLFHPACYNQWLTTLLLIITCYGVAKLFEHFDKEIYLYTGFISGHSLKHLAAAISCWFIVRLFIKTAKLFNGYGNTFLLVE